MLQENEETSAPVPRDEAAAPASPEGPPARAPLEEVTTLREVFPALYGAQYRELKLMERTVDIYLQCLGVRGALRMGNTQFRNFTR